ncbi:hypothetical protein VUJ46_01520 [Chryseobacterium sp. MYb264]|uniref:hypothetical protein n=1 Tax=Chryseobacterium sp. MYb264 TaxID=2745153 RepID=UPI002E12468C|nr:hypothetical protein VUJ46_01520 [Chryseobacterium sp. MYb264]
MPYLADTKIKVSFTNIKLNTDKKLIEGVLETTYDPTESNVISIGDILNDLGNVFTEIIGAIDDAIHNGGMTQAEFDALYADINTYTGQGGSTVTDLYNQGLVDPDLKDQIDDKEQEIKNLLQNLNCTKEETKAKGSNEDFKFDEDCVQRLKDLKAQLQALKDLVNNATKNACIWNVGEHEGLKGKTFYFQKKVEDKISYKLKSGDFPLSFNRFGNVYSFSSNGQVYYPEAGTGKFTTKDVVKYYDFESAGTLLSVNVTESVEDRIIIDDKEIIAMKDCDLQGDKGKGLGKGTLYTKNVEGKYKITVTENNGKISSKFELTGQGDSKTASQKQKIEQQVQTLMDEKLKELEGLTNKTSQAVNTSTEDGGEFFVKQMNGKEWLETLADLGDNVWENATMPESYWNKDTNYSKSNIHIPPTFAGVGDGVIGEVTDYPQLIKLGYDVSTKQEVRDGLWKAVKNINLESIKTAATGVIKTKWDAYANSPGHITYHEMGKDGVTVVSMAMGAGFFKKGADGLKDGIEDTGEKFIKKEAGNIAESFNELLKNPKFKQIYEPLENGNIGRKYITHNVTSAEEASLKLFTQDDYYNNFNKALTGEIPMTTEYTEMKKLMESAQSKLPKYNGVGFRGAGIAESAFAKKLSVGQEFGLGGKFVSSSTEKHIAGQFAAGSKGDVIWEITSKTGTDLSAINPSEAEVLFKPSTKFKVVEIVQHDEIPSMTKYKIIEL